MGDKEEITENLNEKFEDTKVTNWVKITDDYFINLVCNKCGNIIHSKNFTLVYHLNSLKIYCDQCFNSIFSSKSLAREENVKLYRLKDISKELIVNVAENPNLKRFISGNNLYLDFIFLVRNYRDKVEFCNN
ncbi:MAG: hypothetical protein ACTSU2_15395 [Promethearchaeota archaeon]